MGAIFAPLATEAMRAAPSRLAGAASGALNTGRQLGGTLGGAITGAVLASQLTAAMHLRAVADARLLPAAARPRFIAGFSQAARSGLQVGRGQSAASPPRGTPPQLIPELRQLIHDVFTPGYPAAIRPTLAISVAVLLAGAAGCLLLRRHPAAALTSPPAVAGPASVTGPLAVAGPASVASPAAALTSPAAAWQATSASPAAAARPAAAAAPAAAAGQHPEARPGRAASS
jgi:hypothetical protein